MRCAAKIPRLTPGVKQEYLTHSSSFLFQVRRRVRRLSSSFSSGRSADSSTVVRGMLPLSSRGPVPGSRNATLVDSWLVRNHHQPHTLHLSCQSRHTLHLSCQSHHLCSSNRRRRRRLP